MAHGNGEFFYADGDKYEGNWYQDQANGYGIYIHRNGNRYEGDWSNDI